MPNPITTDDRDYLPRVKNAYRAGAGPRECASTVKRQGLCYYLSPLDVCGCDGCLPKPLFSNSRFKILVAESGREPGRESGQKQAKIRPRFRLDSLEFLDFLDS